jgi:hypothetical protein
MYLQKNHSSLKHTRLNAILQAKKRRGGKRKIPVELPVPSDDSRQELLVCAGGLPVDLIV